MTAATLREAAKLMRGRAELATPGPWIPHIRSVQADATHPHVGWISTPQNRQTIVDNTWDGDLIHIAGMHPIVALAVADWLDHAARVSDLYDGEMSRPALNVAQAYLGRGRDRP